MQNIKDWGHILTGSSNKLQFTPNKATKDLTDFVHDKFYSLKDGDDYIWFSSATLQDYLTNVEVIKLLIILNNEGIISDLYIPLEIIPKKNGLVDIILKTNRTLYFNPESAIEHLLTIENMENLIKFKNNFARFRMKDWARFNDKKNDIYIKLGLGHLLNQEKITDLPRLKFDSSFGYLCLGTKKIKIKIGSNQYHLCKTIFNRKPKEKIDADEALNEIDESSIDDRKVYQAMININKKITKHFNIEPPIKYEGSYYWWEETDI